MTPFFYLGRRVGGGSGGGSGRTDQGAARVRVGGGSGGLGWLGRRLFKGCPRAESRLGTARSQFPFFNYSAQKNK